jgi:ribosomal protein L11 methyltransferase
VLEGGAAFGTGDHPTTRLCARWLMQVLAAAPAADHAALSVLDYGCGSGVLGIIALAQGAGSAAGVDIDADSLISARANCARNGVHMALHRADEAAEREGAPVTGEERALSWNKFKGAAQARGSEGAEGREEFLPLSALPAAGFDLTVANILAPVLIELAPALAALTRPGGRLALSGVLAGQAERVCAVYSRHMAQVRVEAEEDGWVLISARRPL